LSSSFLHILPSRTGAAAENMATDFLLLQRYPQPDAARFRHYEWRKEAFTFGFSQKISFVRANLPGDSFDLCRRPTGGGIVDHRNDWTYTLVIPRGHALYDLPAPQSYRAVHQALAAAFTALGQPAEVKLECEPCADGPTVCFTRAERFDVVLPRTERKIAGAAQKRNKHGLLLQGSIEKSAVGAVDWEVFAEKFAGELARVLRADAQATPWPDLDEDELSGLTEQYSSPEWIEYR
jgi:lipoyl(octanoyl) transferase